MFVRSTLSSFLSHLEFSSNLKCITLRIEALFNDESQSVIFCREIWFTLYLFLFPPLKKRKRKGPKGETWWFFIYLYNYNSLMYVTLLRLPNPDTWRFAVLDQLQALLVQILIVSHSNLKSPELKEDVIQNSYFRKSLKSKTNDLMSFWCKEKNKERFKFKTPLKKWKPYQESF